MKINKTIIILGLILMMVISVVNALDLSKTTDVVNSKLITKDTLFKELKQHDNKNTKSMFSIDNPYTKLQNPNLEINFNEVCGKVKSYKVIYYDICYKSYEEPVYKTIKICENDSNKDCYDNQVIDKYKTITEQYQCKKTATSLPNGIYDYEIEADVEMELCEDGKLGYKIDWIPTLNANNKKFEKKEWAWWNTSFDYRREIELTGANATLTDYPYYINFTNVSSINESGKGLVFVDNTCDSGSGTILKHELDYINTDDATYYIKIPSLTTSNKTICMYYNKDDNTDYSDKENVWTNGYSEVYHMTNLSNSLASTDLTNHGATSTTTSKIGKSYVFDGVNDYMTFGSYNMNSDTTMCLWINIDTIPSTKRLFAVGDANFIAMLSSNDYKASLDCGVNFIQTSITLDSWEYICYVNNLAGTDFLYRNGVTYSGTFVGGNTGTRALFDRVLNDQSLKGILDEVYFSTDVKNSDWITQEYNVVINQNSYVSIGAEQTGTLPSNLSVTNSYIEPIRATYNSTLSGVCVGESSGNDITNIIYRWYKNGALFKSGNYSVYSTYQEDADNYVAPSTPFTTNYLQSTYNIDLTKNYNSAIWIVKHGNIFDNRYNITLPLECFNYSGLNKLDLRLFIDSNATAVKSYPGCYNGISYINIGNQEVSSLVAIEPNANANLMYDGVWSTGAITRSGSNSWTGLDSTSGNIFEEAIYWGTLSDSINATVDTIPQEELITGDIWKFECAIVNNVSDTSLFLNSSNTTIVTTDPEILNSNLSSYTHIWQKSEIYYTTQDFIIDYNCNVIVNESVLTCTNYTQPANQNYGYINCTPEEDVEKNVSMFVRCNSLDGSVTNKVSSQFDIIVDTKPPELSTRFLVRTIRNQTSINISLKCTDGIFSPLSYSTAYDGITNYESLASGTRIENNTNINNGNYYGYTSCADPYNSYINYLSNITRTNTGMYYNGSENAITSVTLNSLILFPSSSILTCYSYIIGADNYENVTYHWLNQNNQSLENGSVLCETDSTCTVDSLNPDLVTSGNIRCQVSYEDGIYYFEDESNSIVVSTIGECGEDNPYHFLNMSYFNELDDSAITAENSLNLKIFEGTGEFNINLNFSGNHTDQLCTSVDPANETYNVLVYGDFTISKNGYATRVITIPQSKGTVMDNTGNGNLSFYIIPVSNSSTMTFTWQTTNFQNIDGTMIIERCNGDGTKTIIDSTVISNGEATANLQLYTEPYSYSVDIDGKLYENNSYNNCHIESTTIRDFYIDITEQNILPVIGLYFVDCKISKLSDTIVKMEWDANPESLTDITGCIIGKRQTLNGNEEIYRECSSGVTGSFIRTIPDLGNTYYISGEVSQGSVVGQCQNTIEFYEKTEQSEIFGTSGLLAATFIIISFVLFYVGQPDTQLIATVVGLVGVYILGLLNIPWSAIFALILFLIVVAVIARYTKKRSTE